MVLNLSTPEEEIIEPIQPGYITELEDELSKEAEKDMASRMASELQDDDITKEAQARAAANAAAATNAPAEVVEKSEVIEQAVANAPISPNIAQESEDESPESEGPATQPAPAPAPHTVQGPPLVNISHSPAPQPIANSTPTQVSDNIPH